jgi:polar amino acid transport system substrate-binding protein
VAAPNAVLVAEDEPQLLRLIQRLLERAGYEVLVARDGNVALEEFAAHRERIAIAILDAAITPRGCGELLERIADEHPGPGLVLASGDALESDLRERMLALDGVFLRKPFAPAALLRAIEDSLVRESA